MTDCHLLLETKVTKFRNEDESVSLWNLTMLVIGAQLLKRAVKSMFYELLVTVPDEVV